MTEKKSIPFRIAYRLTGYVMDLVEVLKHFVAGIDKGYTQRKKSEPKPEVPKYVFCEECNREDECGLHGKCLTPAPEKLYCSHCPGEYRVQDGKCINCGRER